MGLHSYSWSSSEAPSIGSIERRCEVERKEKCGFPRKCMCGASPVLFTCTSTDNLGDNVGRKYFRCKNKEAGGCTMLKWWDDAVMEEVHEIKMEKDNLESRIRYINTDCRGEDVDPRMMWNNVLHSRDELYRLCLLSEATEEKYEELKSRVEELESLHFSLEVQRSAMAVKEMKILTAIAVSVALVAFLILLIK